MKAPILNANTEAQAIELLKNLGATEFENRNETNKAGDDILKVVGMDNDFNILGYAIVELN